MRQDDFRTALRAVMARRSLTQTAVAQACGVEQASLSRFLRGEKGLSGESVFKLLPLVYGTSLPSPTPPRDAA
ncbi:helix-turn-helix domain-containing protein [Nitratidesulfovibrio vulgaris]|uniref:helix-turn-helix domain-containing protein n=1 Tax=Nitratidesulfovibrio sp. 1201_IL3209 TaxID=3084053 RepID=UPI0009D64DE4